MAALGSIGVAWQLDWPRILDVAAASGVGGTVKPYPLLQDTRRNIAYWRPSPNLTADANSYLSGVVRDQGVNVPNVLVQLFHKKTGLCLGATYSASDGSFRFDGLSTDDARQYFAVAHDVPGESPSSNNFIDETGRAWSANGNATIRKIASHFGGSAGLFDGGTDYLWCDSAVSTDFDFGTGDFTIEAWIRINTMPTSDAWPAYWYSHATVFSHGIPSNPAGYGLVIGNTKIIWNDNDNAVAVGNHGMLTGTFYHIATTRASGVVRNFVGGVKVGESSGVTSDYTYAGQKAWICSETGNGSNPVAYVDEVRVLNGEAAFTDNFTPPPRPYSLSDSSHTVALLHMDASNYKSIIVSQLSAVPS